MKFKKEEITIAVSLNKEKSYKVVLGYNLENCLTIHKDEDTGYYHISHKNSGYLLKAYKTLETAKKVASSVLGTLPPHQRLWELEFEEITEKYKSSLRTAFNIVRRNGLEE